MTCLSTRCWNSMTIPCIEIQYFPPFRVLIKAIDLSTTFHAAPRWFSCNRDSSARGSATILIYEGRFEKHFIFDVLRTCTLYENTVPLGEALLWEFFMKFVKDTPSPEIQSLS